MEQLPENVKFDVETRALVPGTDMTADEIRREGTYEDVVVPETILPTPTTEEKPKLSEEQNALLVYQKNLNEFIKLITTYEGSKSQVTRAWMNAAISPMNKDEFHFSYPEEKQLFDIFNELNSAKFVLMLYGMVKDNKIQLLAPLMESVEEQKQG